MGRAVGAAAAARCARLRLAPPPSAFAQHVLRVEVDELLEPDHEHVAYAVLLVAVVGVVDLEAREQREGGHP